jgi:DNA-binding Lrp family transcriptional regulator
MVKSTKGQMELDEKKLLAELMVHSKENIDTISKNCGFSKQKTWRMMKQLEKEQKIWGYSIVVDHTKQHLSKFMLLVSRTQLPHNPKDIGEVVANLLAPLKKEHGITMISSYFIHGQYDWVMIFSAEDIMHAKKFAEGIIQKFPGRQTIQISQILFTVRENYIPNPNINEMKEYM